MVREARLSWNDREEPDFGVERRLVEEACDLAIEISGTAEAELIRGRKRRPYGRRPGWLDPAKPKSAPNEDDD